MKKFSDLKIKTKLMVICLALIIVPISALGYFSYRAASGAIFGLIQEKLELQAASYRDELALNLEKVNEDLEKARENARSTVGQLAAVVSDLVNSWTAENTDKLKDKIAELKVGKTGYVFILDYDGKYVVSKGRTRDGDSIRTARDATGRLFIQDILSKGKALRGEGAIAYDEYSWKNEGEDEAREKIAAIIHVPKHKWIVCVSAYFDDLVDMGIEKKIITNFKEKLKGQKVGETGYMYVMDPDGNLIMHPTSEGKNISQHEFIKEMGRQKKGYIQYPWEGKPKVVAFTYYEPKNWIIASGSYLSDFTGPLQKILKLIGIVIAIAIVLGLVVTIAFANSITNPIVRSSKIMNDMAAGDFSKEMSKADLDRLDEVGIIARAIRGTNDNVGKMIAQVKDSADQLASATEEISSSSQQISDGAQQQSASFEELTSSVQSNAESSDHANNLSQNVSVNAKKAEEAMHNTVEAMSCVEKSSGRIAEAVNLITDIADQTNLLALNAAIEAARAGEHGKGFAVVADEVRQLAERSAASAKDIENLIKEASSQVDDGVKVSKQAGDRLNEIVSDIGTVAEQIKTISDSTKEQAAAMEENSSITTSNASSSEELAASAEELAGQAESLQQIVSMFKINPHVVERLHREAGMQTPVSSEPKTVRNNDDRGHTGKGEREEEKLRID